MAREKNPTKGRTYDSDFRLVPHCTTPCCALSSRASDSSDLILATYDRESFLIEIRSEPSNAQSDGSKVHSTVLRTAAHHHPLRVVDGLVKSE